MQTNQAKAIWENEEFVLLHADSGDRYKDSETLVGGYHIAFKELGSIIYMGTTRKDIQAWVNYFDESEF